MIRKATNIATIGSLLIAEPFLPEPLFKRSVIMLCEDNDNGHLGFILNKPSDIKLNDAIEDFPFFDAIIYFGGPVETGDLFYIHTIKNLPRSKEIFPGVYWSGDFERLKFLIDTKQVRPEENKIRFFAGYAGWTKGEVIRDLKNKTWLHTKAEKRFVFFNEPKKLWSEVLQSMGDEFKILSGFPEDPSLN